MFANISFKTISNYTTLASSPSSSSSASSSATSGRLEVWAWFGGCTFRSGLLLGRFSLWCQLCLSRLGRFIRLLRSHVTLLCSPMLSVARPSLTMSSGAIQRAYLLCCFFEARHSCLGGFHVQSLDETFDSSFLSRCLSKSIVANFVFLTQLPTSRATMHKGDPWWSLSSLPDDSVHRFPNRRFKRPFDTFGDSNLKNIFKFTCLVSALGMLSLEVA